MRDDPFRRHDAPPEGVPEQLRFLAPTDVGCDESPRPAPAVAPTSGTAEIGEGVLICLYRFDPTSPISLQVTVPDGETRPQTVHGTKDPYADFPLGPLDPVGTYVITATQGATKATGGFTAVLPRTPLIVTGGPESGPPGTLFRFAVVSSSPAQTVPIDLYRFEESRFVYVTTLSTVTTDRDARASYELPTGPQSPPGSYCLVARPFGSKKCARFEVR